MNKFITTVIASFFIASSAYSMQQITNGEALILAAAAGNHLQLSTLIKDGADIEQTDADGYTALIRASQGRHPECIRMLLEAGASTEKRGENDNTALMFVLDYSEPGDPKMVAECVKLFST